MLQSNQSANAMTTRTMEETVFCRLCLASTPNNELLEDELLETVEQLLENTANLGKARRGRKQAVDGIRNAIICANCANIIRNACEFKSTCENTKVILSHYNGTQGKLDLKMIYSVEKKPTDNVPFYEEMDICRTCLNMIETEHHSCLLEVVKGSNTEDIFQLYFPELISIPTDSPLICDGCCYKFECFSLLISMYMNTEKKINGFNEDEHDSIDSHRNDKILIAKKGPKIMEFIENIDLFYKESTEYDSESDIVESDGYHEEIQKDSIYFKKKTPKVLTTTEKRYNTPSEPKMSKNEMKLRKKKPPNKTASMVKANKPNSNPKLEKCRKLYGVAHKNMWCSQCKWKKACNRFNELRVEPK